MEGKNDSRILLREILEAEINQGGGKERGNARCNFVELAYRGGSNAVSREARRDPLALNAGEIIFAGWWEGRLRPVSICTVGCNNADSIFLALSIPSPVDRSISGPSLPSSTPSNRWIVLLLDFLDLLAYWSTEFFTMENEIIPSLRGDSIWDCWNIFDSKSR